MKIVWMHSHFLNWMGGHQYVYEICKRLIKKHQVSLVTSAATWEAEDKFREIGVSFINLHRITTNNPFYWLFLPLYINSDMRSIRPHIVKMDLIITSYFPAHIWANKLKIPYYQVCYEPLAFYYDRQFLSGYNFLIRFLLNLSKKLYSQFDKSALLEAKAVMTLSQHNAEWIKKIYGRKDISVIYEGVDTTFFKPIENSYLSEKYKDKQIIFHSTDYTSTKGTDLLLEALPEVIQKLPDVVAVISETIPNIQAKQNLFRTVRQLGIAKQVKFIGKLPYADLPKYLSVAKVVVQPSRNQSMSLTIKEAMACQTPVITCKQGKEQFTDGNCGFLVNQLNKEELSDKILKILEKPAQAKQMGEVGRKIVLDKFSWDAVAERILQNIKN